MNEFDEFLWFIDRIGETNIYSQEENRTYIFEINNNIITETINNVIDYNYDYGGLTIPFNTSLPNIVVDKFMEVTQEQLECCICMTEREKQNICKLNCMHTYCHGCIKKSLLKKQYTCPLCRGEIKKIIVQKKEIRDNLVNENSCFSNYF
jgi:hypothetical protein